MSKQRPDPQQAPQEPVQERVFPSAAEDIGHAGLDPATPQTLSPAYRLGYADPDFIMRDELRAARLQLEFLKPEILQRERGIAGTVVFFGSARIPAPEEAAAALEKAVCDLEGSPGDAEALGHERRARVLAGKSRLYGEARRLAQRISATPCGVVVASGGGPGIMEAANRGAADAGAESIGYNIVLPFEQKPNDYVTPELCFNFHYFALRKMHFLLRARALVVFPGGFGTLDETFEVLTLIQTRKIKPIPVLLFDRQYWQRIIDFPGLVEEGVISPADLGIFSSVETAEEAWKLLEPVLARTAPL